MSQAGTSSDGATAVGVQDGELDLRVEDGVVVQRRSTLVVKLPEKVVAHHVDTPRGHGCYINGCEATDTVYAQTIGRL